MFNFDPQIRFSQKLSSLIYRKSKDDSSVVKNSPYRRQDNKLCMSQPILVLSKPTQPDTDADDISDHSTSLDLLDSYHAPVQDHIIGHPRKTSAQSNSSGCLFPDSLTKKQSKSVNASSPPDRSIPNSLKPGAPIMPPRSNSIKLISESSSKPSPRVSTGSLPMPPAKSDGRNVQVTTRTLKFNTGADRPGRIMHDPKPTLPGRRDIGPSRQEYSPSRGDRVGPMDVIMDVDDNSDNRSTINTASSQLPPSPISPRRVNGVPRLSLPPANYRFSLNLVDGYSARMSPSVILRPPPLPLPNLPVLSETTSSTLDASTRRSKRAGLLSMPALPRHGSSRGANGHEELDDVEDEDEDEDEDRDDDGVGNNTSLEDELDTNAETTSSPHLRTPSTSSFETVHECSSPHDHEVHFDITRLLEKDNSPPFLPPLDMSRIDLSFLNPSPLDAKNKGKAKALTEDAGRTPIATRPNKRGGTSAPTALRMEFETKTDAWVASPVITKGSSPTQTLRPGSYFNLPLTQGGQSSSPTQTPRPDFNFPLPISKGGYFNPSLSILTPSSPSSPRPLPTRSTTESRSSVLSITRFPGTYHVASKSLIDVHAVEKKEKVEQMLREEEESAEEERKRRVKAKRMSMRVATTMSHHQELDGQSNASTPIQMQTPHWIDNDSVKPSEASSSSSPTAKQPKRTNNRISMAPAYDIVIPLRRRLSMPTFNATSTAPPPYPDLFPNAQTYGVKLAQIQPRDDEGREKLPAYSNSIYVKAIMPRKLEFIRPGVQAKDRKWKRVLCVLEGTSFKVYKPPGVSVIGGWWENRVGVGDIAAPTTATSSAGGSQMARRGGAGGAARKTKEEIEREIMMVRYITANQPSQFDIANQRRGSSPTTSGSSHPFPNRSDGPVLPGTKSARNLAVHLLSPSSRGHARTVSDVGQSSNTPSVPEMPRSSLNILMNGRSTPTTSFSSSRPQSPMFAASSSSSLTTPAGSRSHHSRASSPSGGAAHYPAASSSSSTSTSKGKKKAEALDLLPDNRSLIKAYTMQNAESGLGSDYVKRKHVIRVRLEGEQFLLQASDVDSVIEWIEVSFLSFLGYLIGLTDLLVGVTSRNEYCDGSR